MLSNCLARYLEGGLLGHLEVLLNFLRTLHTVFHSGCVPTSSVLGPPPPHPLQHLSRLVLLATAVLRAVRRYLTVVLICIALTAGEAERLFMMAISISMSSWEECLFQSSVHFLTGNNPINIRGLFSETKVADLGTRGLRGKKVQGQEPGGTERHGGGVCFPSLCYQMHSGIPPGNPGAAQCLLSQVCCTSSWARLTLPSPPRSPPRPT